MRCDGPILPIYIQGCKAGPWKVRDLAFSPSLILPDNISVWDFVLKLHLTIIIIIISPLRPWRQTTTPIVDKVIN